MSTNACWGLRLLIVDEATQVFALKGAPVILRAESSLTNIGLMARNNLPTGIKPILGRLARNAFDSPNHLFELKWDGMSVGLRAGR